MLKRYEDLDTYRAARDDYKKQNPDAQDYQYILVSVPNTRVVVPPLHATRTPSWSMRCWACAPRCTRVVTAVLALHAQLLRTGAAWFRIHTSQRVGYPARSRFAG